MLHIYRHFPLSSIHPLAVLSAEASEAAAAQGAFWEMHDLLFEGAAAWSGMEPEQALETFVGYAQDLGLDLKRFREEMEAHTYQQKVTAGYDESVGLGLRGTPTFIVNGRVVASGVPLQDFIELMAGDGPQPYDGPPPQVIDPARQYRATIVTSKGEVVVELMPEQAPANVNSFAYLAQDGWYDGQAFFYVQPDVVAYSGDPTNLGLVVPFSGFVCADEVAAGASFDQEGVLAMYAPQPNQNGGMFFITMQAIPELNGQYSVIGRVVEGLDVVRSLAPVQPGDGSAPDTIQTISVEEA